MTAYNTNAYAKFLENVCSRYFTRVLYTFQLIVYVDDSGKVP